MQAKVARSHGQHFLQLKGMTACLKAYRNDPERNNLFKSRKEDLFSRKISQIGKMSAQIGKL